MVDYGVLRGYQKECSDSVGSDFNKGNGRLLVVMPTASGKTLTFGHIAKRYLNKNPDKIVIVVSHLSLLVTQTKESFKKFWSIETDVLQAQKIPAKKSNCILTTMQSLKSIVKLVQWGEHKRVGLIIVDEAHMMFNDSYDNIFSMLPNALILGVTATPFKQNKLLLNHFDLVSFTISAQELIDLGFLVKPELKYIPFAKDDFEGNIRKVIEVHRRDHVGEKSIVYLRTKQQCKDMKQILDNNQVSSAIVTSDITGKIRDKLLKDFKENTADSPDILLTVDVLTAGFDSPNIRSIYMPYPTKSVTSYLQRIGRGLRLDKDKDKCMIYIGGASPTLMKKEWEKVQRKALNLAKRHTKDVFEELEFNKEFMTQEQLTVNKRIADMAKKVKSMNMQGLYDSISTMQVPAYLMDALHGQLVKTSKNNSKLLATPAQKKMLINIGMNPTVTKNEAGLVIDSYKYSKGWRPDAKDIVPSGKFEGWQWKNVPHIYKNFLRSSEATSNISAHYANWKRSIYN